MWGFPSYQLPHTFASLAQWEAEPGHSSESPSVGFSARLGSKRRRERSQRTKIRGLGGRNCPHPVFKAWVAAENSQSHRAAPRLGEPLPPAWGNPSIPHLMCWQACGGAFKPSPLCPQLYQPLYLSSSHLSPFRTPTMYSQHTEEGIQTI